MAQSPSLPELPSTTPTPTIDLPIPTYIPVDFVPEVKLRLQLYRRLADLHDETAIEEMHAELMDRFGKLPQEIEGLLFQLRVKFRAQQANVTAIAADEGQISIRLPYLAGVDRPGLQAYLGRDVRVSRTAVWLIREPDSDRWQSRLLEILGKLRTKESTAKTPAPQR